MNVPIKGHCPNVDCCFYCTLTCTCSYALATGISRTKLHQGENVDINNPCREYTPIDKEKGRIRRACRFL